MTKKSWIVELREAYPTIDTLEFVGIIEEHGQDDDLLDVLDRHEQAAAAKKAVMDKAFEELRRRMNVAEQHHRLNFLVPPDVDREHAQAILAYAFLVPGSQVVYAGNNVLAAEHVLDNTRSKLIGRFSEAKFETALKYLEGAGVLCSTGSRNRRAFSINLGGGACKTTVHGRQIIQAANDFVRNR